MGRFGRRSRKAADAGASTFVQGLRDLAAGYDRQTSELGKIAAHLEALRSDFRDAARTLRTVAGQIEEAARAAATNSQEEGRE